MGDGNDVAVLTSAQVQGNTNLALGSGNDRLTISGLTDTTGTVNLNAGAGNDRVSLDASTADKLFALLGAGNDTLTASGALAFAGQLHVEGGGGRDTLNGKTALTAAVTAATDLLLDLETINL